MRQGEYFHGLVLTFKLEGLSDRIGQWCVAKDRFNRDLAIGPEGSGEALLQ